MVMGVPVVRLEERPTYVGQGHQTQVVLETSDGVDSFLCFAPHEATGEETFDRPRTWDRPRSGWWEGEVHRHTGYTVSRGGNSATVCLWRGSPDFLDGGRDAWVTGPWGTPRAR